MNPQDIALALMTMDILNNVLARADKPSDLGRYLTDTLRELVGGKAVLLLSRLLGAGCVEGVVAISPARRLPDINLSALDALCVMNSESRAVVVIQGDAAGGAPEKLVADAGFGTCLLMPLRIGDILAGFLVIIDLGDVADAERNGMALAPLSTIIALALRHATAFSVQEERLRIATKAANIGIWDWDVVNNELVWDDVMCQLHGLRKEDFGGGHGDWLGTLHQQDRGRVEEEIQAALSGEREYSVELPVVWPDGSVHYIVASGQTFRDADGRPQRMVGTALDITARKRGEIIEVLRRGILEKTASSAPLAMVLVGIAKLIEEDSDDWLCSILLLSPDGQHLLHGAAPSLPEFYNQAVHGITIGEGVGSCGTAAATRRRTIVADINAHPYWAAFKAVALEAGVQSCWSEPIIAVTGALLGTFAIYQRKPKSPSPHDLKLIEFAAEATATAIERKRVESELEQHRFHLENLVEERTSELELAKTIAEEAKSAAERANKAKSAFLANMSHELRTPLNALLGFSQIMAKDPAATPTQKENLAIILKSGEHLLTMINSVLDLAKIESGKVEVNLEEFDLGNLTVDLIAMLRGRAEAKGLQLGLDQSSSFPRLIKSDPAKLRQILINLVGNAIKFTERGQVSIKLTVLALNHTTNKVRLAFDVIDTGPGMAKEDIERVFRPFEQAKHNNLAESTGLGLAIAREYIHMLGGEIDATSEQGYGTTFHFAIEGEVVLAERIPEIHQVQGSIVAIDNANNCKILIVEDQLENRLLLQRLLAPYGFQYREAVNGAEGVAITREWLPHCILMDRRMPVMDGIAATRAIRQLVLPSQPVIISVTAHAFKEEQEEIFAAGCDEFLGKPLKEDDLFNSLAKHLPITITRNSSQPGEDDTSDSSDMPTALVGLPAAILTQLEDAAMRCDISQITTLLADYPEAYVALKPLLETFRFDLLIDEITNRLQGAK